MNIVILIQLLLAHILTDFVFQTPKMVESKNSDGYKSIYFWVHIILAGTLTYVILMQWTNWLVPLFIVITHGFIDFWKIKQEQKVATYNLSSQNNPDKKTTTVQFFLDQFFHVIVILIAWVYLTETSKQVLPFIESLITEKKYITIITALILVAWPVGLAIGKITEPFRNEFSSDDSLKKAGKYIGIFERLLVMIFVLMGQFAAIGFLIAAKSVLRISKDTIDNDARKKTEYVLIGTLISFTIAILIGLVAQYIIKM
jgi:hypothetical protein